VYAAVRLVCSGWSYLSARSANSSLHEHSCEICVLFKGFWRPTISNLGIC